jgi:hypothetical protein
VSQAVYMQFEFNACPNQEGGWPFICIDCIIRICSYFGVDSASNKN